jgi:ABC-2 type transport system ATP-binding protein
VPTNIRTRGLTKVYGDHKVVDHLNLDIPDGEVFGLLGPNGAGKTTTILMLLGLIEPTSGEIEVVGQDPRRNPLEVKRTVGLLPDAVGFYDTMTGRENLRFTARLNDIDHTEERITELLEQVGLTYAGDQPAGEYSRGMKQRLGLADALVKTPSVLILDEPTTAIDPEGVADILAMIRRLAVEERVTILLSSHLLHQVQEVCDRVAIFVEGKVVAQGPPHELAANQKGPARVEFRFIGKDEGAGTTLQGMAGVTDITRGKIPGSWIVSLEPAAIGEVVSDLVGADLEVSGIRRVDDDLDAIYRRYFETKQGATT